MSQFKLDGFKQTRQTSCSINPQRTYDAIYLGSCWIAIEFIWNDLIRTFADHYKVPHDNSEDKGRKHASSRKNQNCATGAYKSCRGLASKFSVTIKKS